MTRPCARTGARRLGVDFVHHEQLVQVVKSPALQVLHDIAQPSLHQWKADPVSARHERLDGQAPCPPRGLGVEEVMPNVNCLIRLQRSTEPVEALHTWSRLSRGGAARRCRRGRRGRRRRGRRGRTCPRSMRRRRRRAGRGRGPRGSSRAPGGCRESRRSVRVSGGSCRAEALARRACLGAAGGSRP